MGFRWGSYFGLDDDDDDGGRYADVKVRDAVRLVFAALSPVVTLVASECRHSDQRASPRAVSRWMIIFVEEIFTAKLEFLSSERLSFFLSLLDIG